MTSHLPKRPASASQGRPARQTRVLHVCCPPTKAWGTLAPNQSHLGRWWPSPASGFSSIIRSTSASRDARARCACACARSTPGFGGGFSVACGQGGAKSECRAMRLAGRASTCYLLIQVRFPLFLPAWLGCAAYERQEAIGGGKAWNVSASFGLKPVAPGRNGSTFARPAEPQPGFACEFQGTRGHLRWDCLHGRSPHESSRDSKFIAFGRNLHSSPG